MTGIPQEMAESYPEKYKLYTITCLRCGKTKQTTKPYTKYCSGKCLHESKRIGLPCCRCGKLKTRAYYIIPGLKPSAIFLCKDCRDTINKKKTSLGNIKLDPRVYPMAYRILDAIRYGGYGFLGERHNVDISTWKETLSGESDHGESDHDSDTTKDLD